MKMSKFEIQGNVLSIGKLDDGLFEDRIDIIIGDDIGLSDSHVEITFFGDLAREVSKNVIKGKELIVESKLECHGHGEFTLIGEEVFYSDIAYFD